MIPAELRHSKSEYRPLLLTDTTEMRKCRKKVMGVPKNGYACLPEGFEEKGTVYVMSDGSLSLYPEE